MADVGHKEDSRELRLEVANISINVLGDIFDRFRFNFSADNFGFGAKNSTFVFELRELDIEGAAHSETGGKALIDGFNLGRKTIGGNNNLFVELVEVVKDIKKLFLGLFLADDELEIVNNETIEFLEFLVKFFAFAVFDRFDEVGVEMGNWGIEDFKVRVTA